MEKVLNYLLKEERKEGQQKNEFKERVAKERRGKEHRGCMKQILERDGEEGDEGQYEWSKYKIRR